MPTVEDKRMLSLIGTKAQWEADDITPQLGEIALEIDGNEYRLKFGNGVNAYSSLPYVTGYTVAELEAIVDARIGAVGVSVSSGQSDANKLVRLNANGKIDSSML